MQNQWKPGPHNNSGRRGVSWSKAKSKWQVNISVDNRTVYVGRYDDLEEASTAYFDAKQRLHPGWIP